MGGIRTCYVSYDARLLVVTLSRVYRQRGPVVGRLPIVSKLQNPTRHGEVDMTLFIK